jgi:uncharacterized membrane protein
MPPNHSEKVSSFNGGEISEAFVLSYVEITRDAAEQALKSLDSSINWAVTVTLAVAAFVINAVVRNQNLVADDLTVLIAVLSVTFCIVWHFSIRTAKSYLNLVRFAKLEREALKCRLQLEVTGGAQLREMIEKYHVSWISPLPEWKIVTKVLFEFGYIYLLFFILLLSWFAARQLPPEKWYVGGFAMILVLVALILELFQFSHSPYLKNVQPDADVMNKA